MYYIFCYDFDVNPDNLNSSLKVFHPFFTYISQSYVRHKIFVRPSQTLRSSKYCFRLFFFKIQFGDDRMVYCTQKHLKYMTLTFLNSQVLRIL